MRLAAFLAVGIVVCMSSVAGATMPDQLEPLSFLLGEWEAGTNAGPHGQGAGSYTFALALHDQAIVRTNHAEYPASEEGPALVHDDLMIIYTTVGGIPEAHFYDSEGHLIHYVVTVPKPGQALFVSDPTPKVPRFRLTYMRGDNGLTGTFEVAPPGKPDEFKTYLTWDSHKMPPKGNDAAKGNDAPKR